MALGMSQAIDAVEGMPYCFQPRSCAVNPFISHNLCRTTLVRRIFGRCSWLVGGEVVSDKADIILGLIVVSSIITSLPWAGWPLAIQAIVFRSADVCRTIRNLSTLR